MKKYRICPTLGQCGPLWSQMISLQETGMATLYYSLVVSRTWNSWNSWLVLACPSRINDYSWFHHIYNTTRHKIYLSIITPSTYYVDSLGLYNSNLCGQLMVRCYYSPITDILLINAMIVLSEMIFFRELDYLISPVRFMWLMLLSEILFLIQKIAFLSETWDETMTNSKVTINKYM